MKSRSVFAIVAQSHGLLFQLDLGYYYLSGITITTHVFVTEYDLHSLEIKRMQTYMKADGYLETSYYQSS
jgi:hypothetical protein